MPIPTDALAALDAKGQSSSPAQPAAPAPQQNAPAAPQADDDAGNDAESDEAVAGSVNLLKLYSRLNGAITELFDSLGVKRSATFPHQVGQSLADHITDVGTQLMKHGGITKNLVTATHTRHDPKGGATVAHPSEQLRQTIIPADFEPAQKAVAICKTLVNKIADLVPDEPAVEQAKSQIKLIGQRDLAGMTAFDAGSALIAIIHPLFQLLARRHSAVKHGGHHNPMLTGPKQL